eukprot:EC726690.1.p1 GENE.EC726690.1~~EC726690.1.p1  ORF type:complete len:201 (+),score=32.61 EC726690.1:99-701(+)
MSEPATRVQLQLASNSSRLLSQQTHQQQRSSVSAIVSRGALWRRLRVLQSHLPQAASARLEGISPSLSVPVLLNLSVALAVAVFFLLAVRVVLRRLPPATATRLPRYFVLAEPFVATAILTVASGAYTRAKAAIVHKVQQLEHAVESQLTVSNAATLVAKSGLRDLKPRLLNALMESAPAGLSLRVRVSATSMHICSGCT